MTAGPRLGSSYRPLAAYLAAQAQSPLTCTFAQMEAVSGRPLPRAAYGQLWWRYSRALRRPVVAAGWVPVAIDLRRHAVTFARTTAGEGRTEALA